MVISKHKGTWIRQSTERWYYAPAKPMETERKNIDEMPIKWHVEWRLLFPIMVIPCRTLLLHAENWPKIKSNAPHSTTTGYTGDQIRHPTNYGIVNMGKYGDKFRHWIYSYWQRGRPSQSVLTLASRSTARMIENIWEYFFLCCFYDSLLSTSMNLLFAAR